MSEPGFGASLTSYAVTWKQCDSAATGITGTALLESNVTVCCTVSRHAILHRTKERGRGVIKLVKLMFIDRMETESADLQARLHCLHPSSFRPETSFFSLVRASSFRLNSLLSSLSYQLQLSLNMASMAFGARRAWNIGRWTNARSVSTLQGYPYIVSGKAVPAQNNSVSINPNSTHFPTVHDLAITFYLWCPLSLPKQNLPLVLHRSFRPPQTPSQRTPNFFKYYKRWLPNTPPRTLK